ncbi:hypothetical protein HanRHA438_Chr13g0622121 [Helianthus annuus]|nr:hypothetical protein HanRHA438_Chr13g0622121 [Helianthus annuus]
MDEDYTVVADFSSLTHYGVWYNLSVVRVEFTWYDVSKNKLLLILLDKDRRRVAAIVPANLVHLFDGMELVGHVFSVSHFQIENFKFNDYPSYKSYVLIYGRIKIVINESTKFTPCIHEVSKGFPLYPLVPCFNVLKEYKGFHNILLML